MDPSSHHNRKSKEKASMTRGQCLQKPEDRSTSQSWKIDQAGLGRWIKSRQSPPEAFPPEKKLLHSESGEQSD